MDDSPAVGDTAVLPVAGTSEDKVKVQFKAVGGAPILKKTKVPSRGILIGRIDALRL